MRRRLMVSGAAAGLAGAFGVAWAAELGPLGNSLDRRERAVVEAVEVGKQSEDAAGFVDDNLDVLLSEDVADAVDGGSLARLFEEALRGGEPDLLGHVVAGVAAEGEVHSGALRPAFVDVLSPNMRWVDNRISAPFAVTSTELPDRTAEDYLALYVFLRETMRDSQSAARLRQALDDYGMAETASAPDVGEGRARRLAELGRVQTFFFEAQSNAERGPDYDENDPEDVEAAQAFDGPLTIENARSRAAWIAADIYGSTTPKAAELRMAARGQPFVDVDGAIKGDMSRTEIQAFREWAAALARAGGPLWSDDASFGAGSSDLINAPLAMDIDDRR